MRLSKAAILALKGMDGKARKRTAKAIGISPVTLYRWIATNHDNLTKALPLKVIEKETGLPTSEILEKAVSEV